MAANFLPNPQLELTTDRTPTELTVHCTGKIVSELRNTVKPLVPQTETLVLDLTNVSYMDSSGLGAIVGLYVSAKVSGCRLKPINLNQRLKELFSITRLGEVMAEGRDPNDFGIPNRRMPLWRLWLGLRSRPKDRLRS